MCRQNYTFAVVNNVFMVHRGIKTSQGNISEIRKLASKQFRKAIKEFKKRMENEHPETKNLCPVIKL